MINTGKNMRSS